MFSANERCLYHSNQLGEVKFIFDLDLYIVGNIPVNHAAGSLETIHAQAFPIFRGAITETLHDALDPMPV